MPLSTVSSLDIIFAQNRSRVQKTHHSMSCHESQVAHQTALAHYHLSLLSSLSPVVTTVTSFTTMISSSLCVPSSDDKSVRSLFDDHDPSTIRFDHLLGTPQNLAGLHNLFWLEAREPAGVVPGVTANEGKILPRPTASIQERYVACASCPRPRTKNTRNPEPRLIQRS